MIESTFSGLEVGKKSLVAQRTALDTVGHNIANASREGYSRQRVNMKAAIPYTDPSLFRAGGKGQIGQGVIVSSIDRIRDEFVDLRIISQSKEVGFWETRSHYLANLEDITQEPLGVGIRTSIDDFWSSWQDLANNTGDLTARYVVAEQGESLAQAISHKYNNLKQISSIINDDIKLTVSEINEYTSSIANLNDRIFKSQAMGDNPNDLMDERDLIVDKLAGLINITIENRRDPREFQVHTNGVELVQGSLNFELKTESRRGPNEGVWEVLWSKNDLPADVRGGKLASLIKLRDEDVRGEIQNLNSLAITLTDSVNNLHREGYSLNGEKGINFFDRQNMLTNEQGSYDRTGDGTFDSTMLYRVTGSYNLKGTDTIGFSGTITLEGANGNRIQVNYKETETVNSLINKINLSGSEVVARLNEFGQLELKATASQNLDHYDFAIRYLEDSGEFLTGYAGVLAQNGAEGAYNWENADAITRLVPESIEGENISYNVAVSPLMEPAAWMHINDRIQKDKSLIAGGFGHLGMPAEIGDNSTALAIASLSEVNLMISSNNWNITDYFAQTLASLGEKGRVAENSLETHTAIMQDLTNLRSSISGVNMDEELSYMIQYQQSFMAASRYINTINSLLDTILNLGGRA